MNQVLFLCTGNYYRSRFAEELFNHCAAAEGLNWRATSKALALERGAANVGPMSGLTRAGLEERGVSPRAAARLPAACTAVDLEEADLVIAVKEAEHRPLMVERHASWQDRVRYWHVHDIEDGPANEALDHLDVLVRNLIAELRGDTGRSSNR